MGQRGDYQNSALKPCKQCRCGVVFSKVISDPVILETLCSIISLLELFSLNVGAVDNQQMDKILSTTFMRTLS